MIIAMGIFWVLFVCRMMQSMNMGEGCIVCSIYNMDEGSTHEGHLED